MRTLQQGFLSICILMVYFFGTNAMAHQQKEAYSTVLFNERTNNIEVSHRFYIHDAEHALARILNKHADIISNAETQHEFAHYIQAQFRLANQNKELLELGSVGYEVDGKFFWVYQEIKSPNSISAVYLKMTALQEVWPGQINHINVEHQGSIRSVRLGFEDDWQKISIH
jgi:hypothetical protein